MTSGKSNGLVLVIIAGLVVVGAGAAGWFLFNKSDPAVAETVPATAEKPAVATPSKTTPTLESEDTRVTPTTQEAPTKNPPREYYVDGKRIRDHRAEGTPPIDLPPVIRPPDARKLTPRSAAVLTKAVNAVVRGCVASIPPEERVGEKPKMEAVFSISIKDKTAKVVKSTVQMRDVRGSAADAAKSCIENNVLGVVEGVEEADIESYDITSAYPF
jgi:hypothetical protein